MTADGEAYISWKEDYEIGISEVDRQHMRLVELINELHASMETGTAAETEKVLQGLVDYTITHFADEERLQERHGYPGLDGHRKLHAELVAEVLGYSKRFQTKEPGLEANLMWFLKDWLLNHIKLQDAKIAKHILAK
ncbi:MAG: bacteriohemerythrin [Nitrospinae bacterium]|nr:bacteriohemerythrin [Nitrospinota bacterium]